MPDLPVSKFAPAYFPDLQPIAGIEMGAIAAGLRYKGRPDLLLMRFAPGTQAAGVFTKNVVKAAPVLWCQDALADTGGRARALVVNAGNANAFTGTRGRTACARIADMTADLVGCDASEVMLASTGVIGESLTSAPFAKPLKRIVGGLSTNMYKDAARAIMTTDTFPKAAETSVAYDDGTVIINGIAKGSGMLAPNMATMLAFVFTNAPIAADVLQAILADVTETSFNVVTADGDTSTNDTVLAFASGTADHCAPITTLDDARVPDLVKGFEVVMRSLAQQLARDAEGIDHLVTVTVKGAASVQDARAVALRISNSPLVKTAIAGNDANWGRILMAAGNGGVDFDPNAISLYLGGQLVAAGGSVQRAYDEAQATAHFKSGEVDITLDLAMGDDAATVWTCDLTHRYIDINADYRS